MASEVEDKKPGVEEAYITANNSSNLRLNLDPDSPRGAADVLVAAGLSDRRVGMALLRLHSEWTACAKPRRRNAAQLDAIAETIRRDDAKAKKAAELNGAPYKAPGSAKGRARDMADRWYVAELRLLSLSLKSRSSLWAEMKLHGKLTNTSPEVVAAALLHWLNPTCPVCDGHGRRKVPGQPALSAKICHKCNGTGHVSPPAGTGPVLLYMDTCTNKARQSLKKRLRREG